MDLPKQQVSLLLPVQGEKKVGKEAKSHCMYADRHGRREKRAAILLQKLGFTTRISDEWCLTWDSTGYVPPRIEGHVCLVKSRE